jgi:hypothetical protein
MTVAGGEEATSYSYINVKVVRAAPLSRPNNYFSVLNPKGEEVCLIKDLKELDVESRAALQAELERRYIGATIQRVNSIRSEFGVIYWEVETQRGRREFVTQESNENLIWLSERRLLILDVDGNRFEVPDVEQLDSRSADLVKGVA